MEQVEDLGIPVAHQLGSVVGPGLSGVGDPGLPIICHGEENSDKDSEFFHGGILYQLALEWD